MARRRIDGMDVHVEDENAPLVGVDIEDVLYENQQDTETIVCYSAEEYEDRSIAYNSARKILLLLQSEGYVEQMRLVRQNAEHHADADRRYTQLDLIKMQGLRMDRIAADYVEKFLTMMMEDAQSTPRPVMAQE